VKTFPASKLRKERKKKMDMNCAYCAEGALVDAFGIKIGELPASKVYLFKEQSHKGRCIVASKHHVSELVNLPEEERIAFMADVCKVAEAIHKLYKPAKVNYGAYGDTGCHLHFHLVPKYTGEFEWGGTFAMNPQLKTLDDAAYSALVAELKAELGL
jgi:diadenosine tetraphosphate (Ap4A) HIT family hydrolase